MMPMTARTVTLGGLTVKASSAEPDVLDYLQDTVQGGLADRSEPQLVYRLPDRPDAGVAPVTGIQLARPRGGCRRPCRSPRRAYRRCAGWRRSARSARTRCRFRSLPHPDQPNGWLIEWGAQLDVRPVRQAVDGAITETAVAGYLAKAREHRRIARSLETYRGQLDNHVLPALGEVRLGEATTPLIDKVIAAIKTDTGAATAKTCRSVISGVMGLAVRYGAITSNPVREVERIEVVTKKSPRALSDEEIAAWLAQLRADEKAVRKDLPDLSLFMLATGVRIGEALALMWDQVDFDTRQVEITHTIIRVKGEGLLRKRTKSKAGERLLGLPLTALAMLRRRFMAGGRLDLPVFPDAIGGFRDPANVRRDIRDARGAEALAWITSHNFRKTTATVLDSGDFTAREIADQLGHSRPSMTQDVYMGRKVRNARAVDALDAMLRRAAEDQNHG
jgi:integrase